MNARKSEDSFVTARIEHPGVAELLVGTIEIIHPVE